VRRRSIIHLENQHPTPCPANLLGIPGLSRLVRSSHIFGSSAHTHIRVPEKELSQEAVAALVQSLTVSYVYYTTDNRDIKRLQFVHATNTQFLCYGMLDLECFSSE